MKTAVILLAAGSGERLGRKKQWIKLKGRPLLSYSLSTLESSPFIHAIYLGVRKEDINRGKEMLKRYAPTKGKGFFLGGERRQDSVYNGLRAIPESYQLIGIHDAARPLLSQGLIERVARRAMEKGAAIPALRVRDTVKEVDSGKVVETVPREKLWAVQTPQFFYREVILKAYNEGLLKGIRASDDATLVEASGFPVSIIEGEERNFKVTYPQDLERLSKELGGQVRIGFGYDVHSLVKGRSLVLGGVRIEHTLGLSGYSDADVLSHAICDALLGAAGMKDIGHHFPDSDPRNKNRKSLEFLEEVAGLLKKEGWEITNVDATLVLQKPNISSYREEMVLNISRALGIRKDQVNIKATTTEGLGFTGREEGIASYATAIIAG